MTPERLDELERVKAERDAALARKPQKVLRGVCMYCTEESEITESRELANAWCREHLKLCQFHPMRQLERDLAAANQRAADAVAGMATARSAEMVEWPRCEASDESRGMRCEKPKGHEGEHYLVTANEWRAIFPLE